MPGQEETTADGSRSVGALQLLALGVNGIVGVGIFFVPSEIAADAPGWASVVIFGLTGLALIPAALAFATLGRRFDQDGGPVVFARAAFGDRVSFLVGWIAYVSAFISTSAILVGLTRALLPSLGIEGPYALRLAAMALITVIALVVALGISFSAQVWTVLTVLKLLPLLALLAAFFAFDGSTSVLPLGQPSTSWLRAALTVTFTFQGFEIVPVVAGQVRSSRSIPAATVGSLVLAIMLYLGLVWACLVGVPALAGAEAPLAETGRVFGGPRLGHLVALGTSISALGIAFGMVVTTPRYLSALAGGSRRMFDLDRVTGKGVPLRALVVTWILVMVLVNLGDLGELFALSSIAVLMQYGVTATALLVLAARRERGLRLRDAWSAVPTLVLGLILVVFGATWREVIVALGVVLVGLVLLRTARPSARAPGQL
jgi:amino acid transporter